MDEGLEREREGETKSSVDWSDSDWIKVSTFAKINNVKWNYAKFLTDFCFNGFDLPTTCMSPDTSIVLKCGASAETVGQERQRWKLFTVSWFYLRCKWNLIVRQKAFEHSNIDHSPSHENFPEMFVSTCDITTCEAFERVVCGWKRKRMHQIAFCVTLVTLDSVLPRQLSQQRETFSWIAALSACIDKTLAFPCTI